MNLRLPFRLVELVAVVLALIVGYLITSHFDVLPSDMKPFVRSVGPGRVAHLSYADVRVRDVRTARYLQPAFSEDSPVSPAGVFLLVTVELRPTTEPVQFSGTWLIDGRGRQFFPSIKSSCDNHPQAATGIITYSLLCFEVPPALLSQFHLELASDDVMNNDTRNEDVADLDLGIRPDQARALAATTAAFVVPQSSIEPLILKRTTITTSGS